jgi:DNA-binding transcriptional LysR family regulator
MESLLLSVSLRRLQVFLSVCETLHMARAAERLGVTQPALSQQIRSLEQALGARLFHRRKRGIDLTSAGRICRAEAEKLLALHARTIETVRRTARGEMGRINLGYVASVMFGQRFPAQLKAVHETFPDIELSLRQTNLPALLAALEAGDLDVVLVWAPVALALPLVHRVHSRQDLVIALPREHPLAQLAKIPISRLAHDAMIGISGPDDIGVMQVAAQLAARAGVTLHVKWQAPEFGSLLGLVAAGLGYGIVPQNVARLAGPEIVSRPLEEPGAHAEYWLVWDEQTATPALHKFTEILLGTATD